MEQIAAWLHRLKETRRASHHLFRAVLPSAQPFTLVDSRIAIHPIGLLPDRPGDSYPCSVGLLRFVDDTPSGDHSLALATEFAALLGIASNRRVEIPKEIAAQIEGRTDTHFIAYGGAVDRQLIGPMPPSASEKFLRYLDRIPHLSPKQRRAFGAAAKLHLVSAGLSQIDIRAAYILAVAGIEVLSQCFGSRATTWEEWERSATFDALFDDLRVTSEQKNALRTELLRDRHLRLKATFQNYVVETLPDSFWSDSIEQWIYPFHLPQGVWSSPNVTSKRLSELFPPDRELLRKVAGLAYNIRSRHVHQGDDATFAQGGIGEGISIGVVEAPPYAIVRAMLWRLLRVHLGDS